MKSKQCVMCQNIHDENFIVATIQISANVSRSICKTCAKLILSGLKRVKKDADARS